MADIFQQLAQQQAEKDPFKRLAQGMVRQSNNYEALTIDDSKYDFRPQPVTMTKGQYTKTTGEYVKDIGVDLTDGAVSVVDAAAGILDFGWNTAGSILNGYRNIGATVAPNVFGEIGEYQFSSPIANATKDLRENAHQYWQDKYSDARKKQNENFQLGMTNDERDAYDQSWKNAYAYGLGKLQENWVNKSEQQQKIEKTAFDKNFDKKYVSSFTDRIKQASMSLDKSISENTEALGDSFSSIGNNPSIGAGAAVNSIPSIFAGGVVGKGLGAVGTRLGTAGLTAEQLALRELATTGADKIRKATLQASAGEGSVMAGTAHTQLSDQSATGTIDDRGLAATALIGLGGAVIGRLGTRVAGRLGIDDVDTLATGVRTSATPNAANLNAAGKLAGATGIEALEEGLQSTLETTSQNIVQGKDPLTDLNKNIAMGMVAGGLMGGTVNVPNALNSSISSISNTANNIKTKVSKVSSQPTFDNLSNPEHEQYNPSQAYLTQVPNLNSEDTAIRTKAQENVAKVLTDIQISRQDALDKFMNLNDQLEQAKVSTDPNMQALIPELETDVKDFGQRYNLINSQYLDLQTEINKVDEHTKAKDANSLSNNQIKDLVNTVQNSTEESITPETQEQLVENVRKYMSSFDAEDLQRLASNTRMFNTEQQDALRQLADIKVAQNEHKDISKVRNDILKGFQGNTVQESHRSLNDYTRLVDKAVQNNNLESLNIALTDMDRWATNQQNKADTLVQAYNSDIVQSGGKVQVVNVGNGQWSIITDSSQFLPKQDLRKNGAWNVQKGLSKSGIDAVVADAKLISDSYTALDKYASTFSFNSNSTTNSSNTTNEENNNVPTQSADITTGTEEVPQQISTSNELAAEITQGMNEIAKGASQASLERAADLIQQGKEVVFSKPDSIVNAKTNPNYNVQDNTDGSVSVKGVLDPRTNEWVGEKPSNSNTEVKDVQSPKTNDESGNTHDREKADTSRVRGSTDNSERTEDRQETDTRGASTSEENGNSQESRRNDESDRSSSRDSTQKRKIKGNEYQGHINKDENGEPQIWYHGTAGEFEQFDLNHPDRKDTGWLGTGVYLTDSEAHAQQYADLKNKRTKLPKNIMKFEVKASKFYELTLEDKNKLARLNSRELADKFTQWVKNQGYEGVIVDHGLDYKREIVVFDTNQITRIKDTQLKTEEAAKIPTLQNLSKQQRKDEQQVDYKTRDMIKAHFDQKTEGKNNPLILIPDFISQLKNNIATVVKQFTNKEINQTQQNQIEHFTQFNDKFSDLIKQTFRAKPEGTRYQDFVNFLVNEQDQFDENTLTALSLAAYSWIIEKGNKIYNTDEDIRDILHLEEDDVIPADIAQQFRMIGDQQANVIYSIGQKASEILGLRVRKDSAPALQSRLDGGLGGLIYMTMLNAKLLTTSTLNANEMKTIAEALDSKSFDASKLDPRSVFTYVRPNFDLNTLELPKEITSIIEINKNTKGVLSSLFSNTVGLQAPVLTMPESFTQTNIRKTTDKVPSQQAKNIENAQQHSFTMRKNTVDLFKRLFEKNPNYLYQLLGIYTDKATLAKEHVSQRENIKATAENEQQRLKNALEFVSYLEQDTEGNYQEFWDTQHTSKNKRMYYDSNLFNIQSGQIHRAMAGLTKFKSTIDLSQLNDEKEWQKYQTFLLGVAEGMEGIEEYIKQQLAQQPTNAYRFGTVDKVAAKDFLPVLEDYLSQDYVTEAIQSMSKMLQDKASNKDAKNIQAIVNEWGMGVQSLQSLIHLAELVDALENNNSKFTTDIAVGSDGINNGVASANMLLGTLDPLMATQVGVIPKTPDQSLKNVQDVYEQGITDYYTSFGTEILNQWNELKFKTDKATWQVEQTQAIDRLFKGFTQDSIRKIAKAWAVPFNYNAGFPRLNSVLTQTFIDGLYKQMVLIADKAIEAKANSNQTQYQEAVILRNTLEHDINKVLPKNLQVKLPSPEQLKEWDFGTVNGEVNKTLQRDVFKSLEKAIQFNQGKAATQATKKFADKYIRMRNMTGTLEKIAYTIATFLRDHLVQQKLNELIENGQIQSKEFDGLSQQELDQIDAQILEYAPIVKTAMSIHSDNALESGIEMVKRQKKIQPVDNNHRIAGVDIRHNNLSTGKSSGTLIGLNLETNSDLGVGGLAALVQSIDASVSSVVIGKTESTNIHDQNSAGIDNFNQMTQLQNKSYLDYLSTYHMAIEHLETVARTLQGVVDIAHKTGINQEQVNTLLSSLLEDSHKQSKEGETVVDKAGLNSLLADFMEIERAKGIRYKSITEALNSLVATYGKADSTKLNTLLNTEAIHQYGGENGQITLTDKHQEILNKEQVSLHQRTQDLYKQLASLATGLADITSTTSDKQVTVESKKLDTLQRWLEERKNVPTEFKNLAQVLVKSKMTQAQRAVFNAIEKLLPANLVVNYFDESNMPEHVNIEGVDVAKVHAWYDTELNTINIKSVDSLGSKVNIETVIHEMLHAALALRIQEIQANPEQHVEAKQALDNLEELRQTLLEKYSDNPTVQGMLENLDEFISYGLTEVQLQELMKAVMVDRKGRNKSKIKSMFMDFLESIAGILGFRSKQINALNAFVYDSAMLLQSVGNVPVKPTIGQLFSRTQETQSTYEQRINDIFENKVQPTATDTRLLDSSDVLDMLGYGGYEVTLHEKHAIGDGRVNHPEITKEDWLKLPDWLDNPVIVAKQLNDKGVETGNLMFVTDEVRNGKVIIVGLNPKDVETATDQHNRQLTLTMYAAPQNKINNQVARGGLLYDRNGKAPKGSDRLTQFSSSVGWERGKGLQDIKTEKDLIAYRNFQNSSDDLVVNQRQAKQLLESIVGRTLALGQRQKGIFSLASVQQSLGENVKQTLTSGATQLDHYRAIQRLPILLEKAVLVETSKVQATGRQIYYYASPLSRATTGEVFVVWFKVTEKEQNGRRYNALEFVKVAPLDTSKPNQYENKSKDYYKQFKTLEAKLQKQKPSSNKLASQYGFNSPNSHVRNTDTLDIFKQLNAASVSNIFQNHLNSLIDSTLGSLYNNDAQAKAGMDQIVQNRTTDNALLSFNLSEKEEYVQQAVQLVFDTYLQAQSGSLIISQVRKSFDEAKKKITEQAFYKGDWATATQQEKDLAEQKYNYVFDTTQSNYLSRFMSMVLSSEEVQNIAGIQVDPVQINKTSWFDRVMSAYNFVISWLADKYVRMNPRDNVAIRINKLMERLTQLDIQARQSKERWYDFTWNLIGKVTKPLNNNSTRAASIIFDHDFFKKNRFKTMRLLGKVASLSPNTLSTDIPNMINNIRNQHNPNQRLGEVMELINEVSSPSAQRNIFDRLVRQASHNAQNRQSITANTKKAILSVFKENGTLLTKEDHKAITYSLLRTDIQSLIEHYSVDTVVNMLTDTKLRNAEAVELENEVLQNPNGNDMLIRAKQLAYYMITNKGGSGLVKNPVSIASGIETTYQGVILKESDPLVKAIDKLVSIYALDFVPKETYSSLTKLISTEANAVKQLIQLHTELVKDAKTEFSNNPLSYTKGYMPEIVNPYREVKIAESLTERKDLEKFGWKFINKLEQDSMDIKSEKYLMIHDDRGYQRIVSGAIDLMGTQHKGTQALNRSNPNFLNITKQRANKALQRAKQNYKTYDPSKDVGLIASYDVDGFVLSYNYEMAGFVRDEFLERNHNFADLLGSYAGMNYYKPENSKQNYEVVDTLYKDYVDNYTKDPRAYVSLSPHSSNPKDVELWRMLPYEFREMAMDKFGSGNPIVVRNDVLNIAFGYKKYSLAQMFDKVSGEQNSLEKIFTGFMHSIFGNSAQANVAQIEHVVQEIVRFAKDIIVIRSISVLWGNIVANTLMLLARGINPVQVGKDLAFSLYNSRKYQKTKDKLQQLEAKLTMGGNIFQLEQEIAKTQDELKRNPLAQFIEAGMLSSIVEDVAIQQGDYTYTSEFKKQVEQWTKWIPSPAKTIAEWLVISPSTAPYQFLATTTQLSDFTAKYTLFKHLQSKEGMSFEDATREASQTFINYDMPTAKGMQYMNDMGMFMFTKFFLRFQSVLMRQLDKRAASIIGQHLATEMFTDTMGILDPLMIHRIGNNPFEGSALNIFNAVGEIPTVNAVF